MVGRRTARRLAVALAWGMVLAGAAYAQKLGDDPAALNAEMLRLSKAGKYTEATEIAKRLLAIREKELGPDHPRLGAALNSLALLYGTQGRYTEAEPLYKRSLAIAEKPFGPEHPAVGRVLNNLAGLYRNQGRYADAEPLFRRDLSIAERALGPEHPDVGASLNNLALLYRAQSRHAEAEPLLRRSLPIAERVLGPDHPHVGMTLEGLALLYQDQGRFGEAEPLFKRSLVIMEKASGADHTSVATTLNNLAGLHVDQGRYGEAEPLMKRSLGIIETALGPEHPRVGGSLNNLAELYRIQGRYAEAEPLLKRNLAIHEKALGREHPDTGLALNNLAALYQAEGRFGEAEPLFKRSLSIVQKAVGPEHRLVGTTLNNLAELYRAQGQHVEAEALYRRSIAIFEKALGPEHPDVGQLLNNLAVMYEDRGRYAEAEPVSKRSLAIREKALGPDHPHVGQSLNNLAWLAFGRSDWAAAGEYWRRSTDVIKRRTERGLTGTAGSSSKGEAQRLAWQFWGLIKMTYQLAVQRPEPNAALAREMFEAAQWALSSEAATSLAQMSARSAKASPELSGIVRERQDLVSEWQAKDKLLIVAKSEPPEERKAVAEKVLADRLSVIDTRLADIDRRLAMEFPEYAALASPAPVSVVDVQGQLGADEALVLFLDTPEWKPSPEESFIWVVTKSSGRWAWIEPGTAALTREVVALRCGLDATAWQGVRAEACAKALGIPLDKAPRSGQALPFDHARAHRLYTALFGGVQGLIKGKHLLIVPSGPLTQLPFHVLVTRPPTSGNHRVAAWLAREHAVTVLPAVSSLKALRRVGRPSAAPRPMFGIGNPLLDGHTGLAKLARAKQRCPETLGPWKVTVVASPRGGVAQVETRGGLADLSHIKAQIPLPVTADELCAVAQDVKADVVRDIRLGSLATEREIKRLSASGELAKYRMVHFATHGVLARQLDGTHEPGLILSPPEKATEEDDGYLTASEIATLKLDADWAILSACNTAAGASTSAEALSGLARAFIYAQTRALLVSHWEVYSAATVKLITTAIREMANDPKVGRAEAMRRSMLALIDKGAPEEAHPAYWAPFVVVGEGAARR